MSTIRSFVKIKSFGAKTNIGTNFNEIRKGVNRLGTTLYGVGTNLEQSRKLIEFEREFLRDQYGRKIKVIEDEEKRKETFADKLKKFQTKLFGKKKRNKAEIDAEAGTKDAKKDEKKRLDTIKKPIQGFFRAIGGILGTIVKYFIMFGVLDFMEKNPDQVVKLFKLIFAIGKFAKNIAFFGIGTVMDGLTNLFGDHSANGINENIVARGFRFLFGALQLFGGIAALKLASYVIMPWKLMQDINFVRGIFNKNALMEVEGEVSAERRSTGYRDKKTGVIYTKEEVEQMRKSARRQDAKRAKGAGKGYQSSLYQDELDGRLQGQFNSKKGPLRKLQQRGRIAGKKFTRGIGRFAKANPGKVAGGFAVLGGVTRIAGGLASGESTGTAVGAGVGQAVGGIAGAAALTAVAPFLGPLAPILGNMIGGFLGEWVGKTIGPILEPIFGPIGRYFKMLTTVVGGVFGEAFQPFKELFGALFEFVGAFVGILFDVVGILKDFIGFVLKGVFDAIGKTVQMVISAAKRLMDPKSVAAGYVDFLTFGLTDLDGMGRAAGGPVPMAMGGNVPQSLRIERKQDKLLELMSDKRNGIAGILQKLVVFLQGLQGKKTTRPAESSGMNNGGGSNASSGNTSSGGPGGTTPKTIGGGFDEKFAALLGDYEGLRLEAYKDANYGWEIPTIGIGATYYPSGFRKSGKVKRGDTITEEEAYWIKSKHIIEHRQRLIDEVGSDYNKAPNKVKAGLESVVFNYGSLDGAGIRGIVKQALNSGDYGPVVDVYRNKLANHNGGRNNWRRNDEAIVMETGTSKRTGIQFAAEGGKIIKDVPYVNQRSLPADKYGTGGDAQCYSSTMSMWAQFLLGEKAENASIENYTKIREKYGISTLPHSQESALRDLGITAHRFLGGKSHDDMRKEIDKGNPVPIGFKYDHWGLLVGYQGQDWIVSDPYGQLVGPPRGSFQKLNSRGQKTNGVGKYWKMSAKDMQHQNPNGDVWMWKTSRVNKNAKFGGTAKDAGGDNSGGNNANTDSQTSPAATETQPQTLAQSLDSLINLYKVGFRDAFSKGLGLSNNDERIQKSSIGNSTFRGEAAESAVRARTLIDKANIGDDVSKKWGAVQTRSKVRAQKQIDDEMDSAAPVVITNEVVQPVINNVGGGRPTVVHTKPSPMLTQ